MSKRKLLLADDSVTIQKVVNLTFADEGIEVISVSDGDSAMEKVAEISPDLVMADVNMPGLNGYQICEQIRQNDDFRQTPVILLVGSFEPFDEDEARRVGADDFLTKPFQSIRQLVNKVTVLLNSEAVAHDPSPENKTGDEYEDTLEMESPTVEVSAGESAKYEDSGFEDDTIQTSRFSGYAPDEVQKLETRELVGEEQYLSESQAATKLKDHDNLHNEEKQRVDFADYDAPAPIEEANYEIVEADNQSSKIEEPIDSSYYQYQTADNTQIAKDEPENYEAVGESSAAESPVFEKTGEASEKTLEDESPAEESSVINQDDEIPLPEVASVLESDEDDLLELPPIESDFEEDTEQEETEEIEGKTEETSSADVNQTASEQPASEKSASEQVSSELVDIIVQKVLEKISEKSIKEVAWEVVPQMTELIVKKMAEEKLKD